jgi:hypothetical protein
MSQTKLRCTALILIACAQHLLMPSYSSAQDLSPKDRRLNVAVLGFDLNEAAAKNALAEGANINAVNGALNGETMLITAIKGFKDPETIKFLLANGADANIQDESGRTALSWATQYNIGKNRNGRDILKMLQDATGQGAANTAKPADPTPVETTRAATPRTVPPRAGQGNAPAPVATPRRANGPPTADEIKAALEKSFTKVYENHFFGVRNKVTFEWIGGIAVGAPETRGRIPTACYPAKLNVKVTAEDPRDGNQSTVARGTDARIGGYSKTEIFCFSRNGFGEWEYVTYEQ